MGFKIEDGSGSGVLCSVSSDRKLNVVAVSESLEYNQSIVNGEAYTVNADLTIAATDKTCLLLKNTSPTKNLVITKLKLETIGAAASNVDGYWTVNTGGGYTSGGTAKTPVNLNGASGNEAPVDAYDGTGSDIVMSAGKLLVEKSWQANAIVDLDHGGALILGTNNVLSIWYKGSTAAGSAIASVTFIMVDQ